MTDSAKKRDRTGRFVLKVAEPVTEGEDDENGEEDEDQQP